MVNLFTLFKNAGRTEIKAAQKTTQAAKAVKTVNKINKEIKLPASMTLKSSTLTTKPKTFLATSTSFFGDQARNLASNKVVRSAGIGAASAGIVGAGIYVGGKTAGSGVDQMFSQFGSGWRNLTNQRTNEETRADQLANMTQENGLLRDRADILDKYLSFLGNNGIPDTPSNRQLFSDYVMGSGPSATPATNTSQGSPWMGIAAITLLAAGGLYAVNRKKKGK